MLCYAFNLLPKRIHQGERLVISQAWRRRWFVLRRGRMNGDPDVLEYYRSKSSRKPIRSIDLRECEVQVHVEVRLIRREFQNQHLFLVKTSSRIFYLVAKTEEEMNSWVRSIGQICHFDLMSDSTDSVESQQPSPAMSPDAASPEPAATAVTAPALVAPTPTPTGGGAAEGSRSESERSLPLDYLFLSQCETGPASVTRCNSCSNSDRSLEYSSSDNTFEDVFPSPLCPNPFSPFLALGPTDPPLSASSSISSQNLHHPLAEVFQFDKPPSSSLPNGSADGCTPPPRPPKPSHFTERSPDDSCHLAIPRRISLAGLDHVRRGEFEGRTARSWNKRLSLNLPHSVMIGSPSWGSCNEDSYVPMDSRVSSPVSTLDGSSDGYIPMSPSSAKFLLSNGNADAPPPVPPSRRMPCDLEPPPVNRDLKPRRRARPPPLDLRGLSTIREYPTHLPLIRTHTEPGTSINCWQLERKPFTGGLPGGQEDSCFLMESKQLFLSPNGNAASLWPRRSNLDYLSLDFNSASPSPVQKKPFLSDEDRVDYVLVDEQKTQALQNTKMEWKDVRQSKV
ncbi:GRB2-associated-binding protein 3 isoform X2 [Scleropages formosus]|uniref:GRB2-associated-binding protein 3 isoform X2 n=1 Tax=Scleropages formosus TaxID=113540 RepID=UPI0010FA6876|nr:GRB2-associated-binding protein 3 isoform X2 [Scleropages formosus]